MHCADSDFVFSSKAQTLERLSKHLTKSSIPNFIYFSLSDWTNKRDEILKKISGVFNSNVVVRSSALNEDSQTGSMAGYYKSILNISPSNQLSIGSAIDSVFDSYKKGTSGHNGGNLVLVQSQVQSVDISGVAFSRDPDTDSPYIIIHYDDYSGRTDIITSGSNTKQKIFTYCKLFDQLPSDKPLASIIQAIQEIEKITSNSSLDIEFVFSKGQVYILQVRPIATRRKSPCSDKEFLSVLEGTRDFLDQHNVEYPNLCGTANVYGIMPDWNPAEIIGTDPKPLSLSLYRYLITDEIWPRARAEIGYRDIGFQPGIVSLAGKPFVDVRMSFNTFIPATLPDRIAGKLVDFYTQKLRRFQDYHDKIEFKIAYTCYEFDTNPMMSELLEAGFSKEEANSVVKSLFELTNSVLSGKTTTIEKELVLVSNLAPKRKRIFASQIPAPNKIAQLLHDCRIYGTLPFSKLARFAFMGTILMNSLVRAGAITENEKNSFFRSIKTVATDFLHHIGELKDNKITSEVFLSSYGHLRPGTYDICSPSYAEKFSDYVDLENFTPPPKHGGTYSFSPESMEAIEKVLKAHGFSICAKDFLAFVGKSVAARELSKFEFTKNLSLILDYIHPFLSRHGLTRDESAFVNIWEIMDFASSSPLPNSIYELRKRIDERQRHYQIMRMIRLPPVIFLSKNVAYFRSTDMSPNYITNTDLFGEVVYVPKSSVPRDMRGKIVLIENADPGYDWIFSHGIAGLITEFGGAASHMAIRAAEFNLPAAIGCGPALFALLKGCKKIELNCSSKQIRVIL